MAQGFSLKDQLFNRETVTRLGDHFEAAGVFTSAAFVDDVLAGLTPLELKARITFIAQILAAHLPQDFSQAAVAIRRALPPPLDPGLQDDDFGHFIYAPLGAYVEMRGLEAHRDLSLDLLVDITQRFSMEYAIRAFINRWPDAVLERMQDWAIHPHYHVRRLVSEGTRPKLPWGQAIRLTHTQTLPLLDALHADPTRFVTRSVANHLNDISKSDADGVIDTLEAWENAAKQDAAELLWMRKHALRGLVKAGHPRALSHLGYTRNLPMTVDHFAITPDSLARGEIAEIAIDLTVATDAPLLIDYVIDYVKANGSTAPRTSKCKTITAQANKTVRIRKKHHFKADATTFRLHAGAHRLHLQVNGKIVASTGFALT